MYSSRPSSEKGKTAYPLALHVDMDAFFASVEIRSDPRLRDLPVVVGGGPGPRGVVTAASYPARRFGIRSGMSMARAHKLCPQVISLPVNPSKVVHESLAVLEELERLAPRVDPTSIDEATVFFDPIPRERWAEEAAARATQIQNRIFRARGLTCSVGAGVNRLQAKMGSALRKPFGITVIPPGSFRHVFGGRSAESIPGIGERTFERLGELGIATINNLADAPLNSLTPVFGRSGARVLQDLARGRDDRSAHFHPRDDGPKSASHEMTFGRDVADPFVLQAVVSLLSDRVARRLRHKGLFAKGVGVRFTVGRDKRTRQKKLVLPTDRAQDLSAVAWPLLQEASRGRALRLVGVVAMHLDARGPEPGLFPQDRRLGAVIRAGDRLRDRFGEHALTPARACGASSRRSSRLRGWHAPEKNP